MKYISHFAFVQRLKNVNKKNSHKLCPSQISNQSGERTLFAFNDDDNEMINGGRTMLFKGCSKTSPFIFIHTELCRVNLCLILVNIYFNTHRIWTIGT